MKSKRSPEEIKAWRAQLRKVAERVSSMPPEEQSALAAEYGTRTAEGHPLSTYNTLFLAFQAGRPLAQVGGFQQWKRVGRMVRKGEHACGYIWVPVRPKGNGNGDETEAIHEPDELRFLAAPVFDVTQTEAL